MGFSRHDFAQQRAAVGLKRDQWTALLFSTDPHLDPTALYRYDKARVQIEFLFRDSQQFVGLTHGQARRTDAITFQVNASLTAVSLSKDGLVGSH